VSTSSALIDRLRDALLLESPNPENVRAELVQELGLSPDQAQQVLYEVVKQLNAGLFPPVTELEVIHTEGCNLACSYCFEKNMLGVRRMSPEVARAAVDLLFEYALEEAHVTVTHFGGEPTLNFTGIQLVTEYSEERAQSSGKSVSFDMTTNGLLLDERMRRYLAEHRIRVLLSIDGLRQSHDAFRVDRKGRGTFTRVLESLTLLKRWQPWIGVKMTVMPDNVARLGEDVRGLYDAGVNQFIIGHATGVRWSAEAMTCYGEQLQDLARWYKAAPRSDLRIDDFERGEGSESYFGCSAGRSSIAVAVTGEVSPCSKVMGLNSKELIGKLGDVSSGLFHLRNRAALIGCSQLKAACEEQEIAEDFRGGCFAVNFGETGDLFKPSLQQHALSMVRRSACAGCSSASFSRSL
jgi:uncharacterized protein